MSAEWVCPNCAADLRGEPIPEKYRVHQDDCAEQKARSLSGRCFCLPYGDSTHFQRVIGLEVRGVYDGVVAWQCPDCGHRWPRFTEETAPCGSALAVADAYLGPPRP